MNSLFTLTLIACMATISGAEERNQPPPWHMIGDEKELRRTYTEAEQVVVVCIYSTQLEDIRPPFASIVHYATVTQMLKGTLQIGQRIEITFATDSLPIAEDERVAYIKKANESAQGDLRFAFLFGGKVPRFSTEFLYIPRYSEEMSKFLADFKTTQKKGEAAPSNR